MAGLLEAGRALMIGLILAAEETVTSPGWWQQAASVTVTVAGVITAVFGAGWSVYRFVPGVRRWWLERQARQKLVRAKAMADIVVEALGPVERRMDAAEHLGSRRHQQNLGEMQEIAQRVGRVEVSQREIHKRIDRHMDEEREERQADRAELLGWLNMVGAFRREDVQALRDRRTDDQHET